MTAPRDGGQMSETVHPVPAVPIAAALALVTGLVTLCRPGDFFLFAEQLLGRPFTPRDLDDKLTVAKLRVAALEKWPQLANETGAGVSRDNKREWLAKRAERYGAEVAL